MGQFFIHILGMIYNSQMEDQSGRFILKWTSHDPDSESCFKLASLVAWSTCIRMCGKTEEKKGNNQRNIAVCNGETYSDLEVQY